MTTRQMGLRRLRFVTGALPLVLAACSGTDGAAIGDAGFVQDTGEEHRDAGKDATRDTGGKDAGKTKDARPEDGAAPESGPLETGADAPVHETGVDATNGDTGGPDSGAVCGDGHIDGAEQCDLGMANGTMMGCSATCAFDCTADTDCGTAGTDTCAGAPTCVDAMVQGQAVKQCTTGMPQPMCSTCGASATAGLCDGTPLACHPSTCGDGCVDATKGEQCDPPNGTTCDASCHSLVAAACGNGVLDPGEQCDDDNLFDLDGCDSKCNYEVVSRMTSVAISGSKAPSFCTPTTNRLGTQSLTGTALGQLNTPLQTAVTDGSVNILLQFLSLSDLTGQNATNFSLGVVNASVDPAKGACGAGGCPIDWWFLADRLSVSAGLPTTLLLPAALNSYALSAGPSNVTLTLDLAGAAAALSMRQSHLAASVDKNPAPDAPAPPPSALAAGLTVFQTITGSGSNQGLCGNVTVESLAKIPIPASLASGGSTACGTCPNSRVYTACAPGDTLGVSCNSLLDVLVSGCGVLPVAGTCLAKAINPLQPDVSANGAVVRVLTPGNNGIVPTSQTMGNEDAYSSYFTFKATRAHLTGGTCAATMDCQAGKTCTGGSCI